MSKLLIKIIIFIAIIFLIGIIIISFIKNKNSKQNFYKDNNIENFNNNINEEIKNNEEIEETMQIYIKVNNRTLTAILENNSSAVALAERLKQNDITINMSDYGSFEKVGNLGFSLPRNDKQIATEAGDLILYQGNSITIYYDTNSWNFTKLGRIIDITQDELKEILGKGDVTVTFSLEK